MYFTLGVKYSIAMLRLYPLCFTPDVKYLYQQ